MDFVGFWEWMSTLAKVLQNDTSKYNWPPFFFEFWSMLSIPYRNGRYGRNIPYRPAIRYSWPLYFVPVKIPAIPTNTGYTGRYLNIGPKHKKACFINFDIFKGKIVILLNPNSKTLALPSSCTTLFLSFFLSHALSQLLCSLTLSANLSLTLSAALSLTRRCSVSHSLPLLCLSLSAALSLTLRRWWKWCCVDRC